ncbi:MAG: hypothetical protein ACLTZY_02945 [Alistipes indistinctus]
MRLRLRCGAGAERTPAAEAPEAAPLVGDKNLINESTIIGKQEKYEASNITIHNNITEDHSHTTIVCAVSGKRIYLDHSVVCPKCGKQVALEYYVEASKRCENCEQQARGVPCVRRADDGGQAARCGVQAAVGCRSAAVADRRRDAGFDPQGAAAKARREICRAHLRAACRTGSGRVAPDHGDGARTGARKASKPSPCCTKIRRTTRPTTGISSRGRSSARRSRWRGL